MDFDGKVVLVTGGSRGIGRACSEGFAAGGATVAINFLGNDEAAQATLASLGGGDHFLIKADVADPEAVKDMVGQVITRLGRIDVLVNNAGIYETDDIANISYEEWQEVWQRAIGINLLAAANASYWAVHHMMKQGGGRIINIASRGGFRGEPDALAYAATKTGLSAMSKSLAQRAAKYGITVSVVAPGWVETDMAASWLESPEDREAVVQQFPIGRIADPKEVANAVLFLASEGASFTTGTTIDVNGASWLRP